MKSIFSLVKLVYVSHQHRASMLFNYYFKEHTRGAVKLRGFTYCELAYIEYRKLQIIVVFCEAYAAHSNR